MKIKLKSILFSSLLLLGYTTSIYAQPTITQQPQNQSVLVGSTATFSLTATGVNPLTYQWYKGGVLIPSATLSSYTTPATILGENGSIYYCIVTDSTGFIESNNATLTVGQAPLLTQHPQNLTVLEGLGASFSVTATGTLPINYQWRKNGTDISGANLSTFSIPVTTLADNGTTYSCVASNSFGIVISNAATLTITPGQIPVISQQPINQAVLTGQAAIFSVTATGTAPIQYQWKKNNVIIPGATLSSYTTPLALLSDNLTVFTCTISNSFGSITSNGANLYVTNASTRVSSGIQVLYEFEDKSGDVIKDVSGFGAAEDIKIITPDQTAWTPNGLETFFGATTRREVTDSKLRANVVASNEISLEVWIQPEFIPQSSRRIFTYSLSGSFRNFSIIAEGDHYEFRLLTTTTDFNGLPSISSSSGTQNSNLTHLVYTRSSDGTAKVYVNGVLDATGSIPGDLSRFKDNYWLAIGSEPLGGLEWRGMHYLSAVYDRALTEFEIQHNYSIGTPVDRKPAFTIHPKDKFIIEGESVIFDSYATSVLPLTYQWTKNGQSIPGANDRKLDLSNLGRLDNGAFFQSRATTSAGTTISNSATLYVTSENSRVSEGVKVLYNFNEGSGSVINDISGFGSPLKLNIFNSSAVSWEQNGLRILTEPSIVTTSSATKITSGVKASDEITIEAWLSPANNSQANPARILTLSANESSRNFSLGQNNDSYVVNLRATSTDNNGLPSISSSAGTVSQNGFDHVVFTRSATGEAKFYINGTLRVTQTISGDLSNWNDSYLLSLGNEFGVDHHWKGLVNLIAVFDRALTSSEVLKNYNFGAYGVVEKPTDIRLLSNQIGRVSIGWNDNSNNEEGFIVERGTGNPINFSIIGNVNEDSTEFTDENILDNKTYYYRIKSFYPLGESNYSDTLMVKSLVSPLSSPSNLVLSIEPDGYPKLVWNDNSSTESGFVIQRRKFAQSFTEIDTVDADVKQYVDRINIQDSTTYIYRIYAFNSDTTSGFSNENSVDVLVGIGSEDKIPMEFSFSQNYPNPFNPSTKIKFSLPENSMVRISVFNLLGQKVADMVNGNISAGYHEINFNASHLTSGIYIYSIEASGTNGNKFQSTKKMILLK